MKKMDLFYIVLWIAVAVLALHLGQKKLAPFFLIYAMIPVFFETTERRTLKLRRWRKKLSKQMEKVPESPEPEKEAAPAHPEPEMKPAAPSYKAEAVFEYKVLENDSVSIEKYKGNSSSVVIPATLGGKPVGRIGCCAFQFCTVLQKVVIPEGVTVIGSNAFHGCRNLTDAELPESLVIIGRFAFWQCWKLKNINVPQSLQRIEYLAFGECEALREFRLHDDIQVDSAAFNEAHAHQTYESEGVIFALQKDGTLHITGYRRPLPRPYQQLRNSIRGHRLVKILPDAFRNCQEVIEMVIPEGVTEIGSGAFQGCPKLRLLVLPASLTYIGEDAIPDISAKEFEDEKAAYWAELQYDPWARKEYGLYDPIIVESKPGKVKVVPGSYAESWCRQHGISVVYK